MIRIGCVSYLNSRVLIHGLREEGPGYTLELHEPSALARKLAAGELDVALVSSIEYFRHPEYTLLPGLGVCGDREMWSIRLFHRVSAGKLRRVGLDPASETTNALLRIVLKERHGLDAEYVPLKPGEDPAARSDLDGFLKIGDPCLRLAGRLPGWEALDLLAEWRALTGKPFVFAAWLVRGGAKLGAVPALLARAKEEGLRHAVEIAAAHHEALGITRERALQYITRIVRYELGKEEMEGLERFQQLLRSHDLIRAERKLERYGG